MKYQILSIIALTSVALSAIAAPGDRRPNGGDRPERQHNPMFQRLDANNDGFLALDELISAANQRSERIFGRLDTDDDGAVSQEEYAAKPSRHQELDDDVKACAVALIEAETGGTFEFPEHLTKGERFAAIDSDGDLQLTQAELTAYGELKAGDKLTRLDRDNDGLVSQDEWNEARAIRHVIRKAVHECQDDNVAEE